MSSLTMVLRLDNTRIPQCDMSSFRTKELYNTIVYTRNEPEQDITPPQDNNQTTKAEVSAEVRNTYERY